MEAIAKREGLYETSDVLCKECHYTFCPARLLLSLREVNEKQLFCLSFIPHFHSTSIFDGNPHHLPEFLQLVLRYYAGCSYLDKKIHSLEMECSLSGMTAPSSTIHLLQTFQQRRRAYIQSAVAHLRTIAEKELHHTIDDVFACSENEMVIDGKSYLYITDIVILE